MMLASPMNEEWKPGLAAAQSERVDFITKPAPNRNTLIRNEPDRMPKIGSALPRPCGRILHVAAAKCRETLLPGPWGRGVFGNDPAEVAAVFAEHLLNKGWCRDVFRHISFCIPER